MPAVMVTTTPVITKSSYCSRSPPHTHTQLALETRTHGLPAAPSARDRRRNPTYAARGAARPQPAGPQPCWRRPRAFPGRPGILCGGATARPASAYEGGSAPHPRPAHSPAGGGGASGSSALGCGRGGACRTEWPEAAGWTSRDKACGLEIIVAPATTGQRIGGPLGLRRRWRAVRSDLTTWSAKLERQPMTQQKTFWTFPYCP